MSKQLTPSLKAALRWLRKHYPTSRPVTVRIVTSLSGLHGEFIAGDKRSIIRLAPDLDSIMQDTLLEEYAHHLRNECPLPWADDAHDALFWAILGVITKKWRGE
jgi:hypothetical protein